MRPLYLHYLAMALLLASAPTGGLRPGAAVHASAPRPLAAAVLPRLADAASSSSSRRQLHSQQGRPPPEPVFATQPPWMPDVEVHEEATPETEGRDVAEADLERLFKDSLYPDVKPWQGRNLTMDHFERLVRMCDEKDPWGHFRKVILIKNNTLHFLGRYTAGGILDSNTHTFWQQFQESFNGVWRTHRPQWPDTIFLLSVDDPPTCQPRQCSAGPCWDCPAPVLTYFKNAHADDILVPIALKSMDHPLYLFPWEKKKNQAIFRGFVNCGSGQNFETCSRIYFANWTYFNKVPQVDAGLTCGWGYHAGELSSQQYPFKLPKAPFVPLKEHARYKYLLALDGHTAPNRFGFYMHVNSVILKQQSKHFEWFYRSLRDGVHYLSIWKDHPRDVLDVMAEWEAKGPEGDAHLRAMVQANVDFAVHYTGAQARLRFFIRALGEYKRLFGPGVMQRYIDEKVWPAVLRKVAEPRSKLDYHHNMKQELGTGPIDWDARIAAIPHI